MRDRLFVLLAFLIASPLLLAAQKPKPPEKPVEAPAAKKSPKSPTSKTKADKPPAGSEVKGGVRAGKEAKKDAGKQAKKQSSPTLELDPAWVSVLNWRSIGPASMGGRIVDFAVVESDPIVFYVATASGGLQDNGSWGGPSRTRGRYGPSNGDWYRVGGADGFVCRADPDDPDLVYYEAQFGRIGRVNVRTGERASIRPKAEKDTKYRFNWRTPFILSNHNSRILYCAGNYVFRSLDRGNDLRKISPEITTSDRGSATALAESPLNPDILYAGTDDGTLWVTHDGGDNWRDITKNVGLAERYLVGSIESSRHEPGRAYIALDGHRSDDDAPHIYATEDNGETWRSITGNLPVGSTRCLREDVVNPDLLYCGTEFAIWASLDRGGIGPKSTTICQP